MMPERLKEIETLVIDALNEPPPKRPPYGDTSGRLDLDMARVVLDNTEHEPPTQEAQDTLFVELRMACNEVEILRRAVATMPGLIAEVRRMERKLGQVAKYADDLDANGGPEDGGSYLYLQMANELRAILKDAP